MAESARRGCPGRRVFPWSRTWSRRYGFRQGRRWGHSPAVPIWVAWVPRKPVRSVGGVFAVALLAAGEGHGRAGAEGLTWGGFMVPAWSGWCGVLKDSARGIPPAPSDLADLAGMGSTEARAVDLRSYPGRRVPPWFRPGPGAMAVAKAGDGVIPLPVPVWTGGVRQSRRGWLAGFSPWERGQPAGAWRKRRASWSRPHPEAH